MSFQYEPIKLKYTIPETDRTYCPDFVLANGIIVEAKGQFDREMRKKMELVIAQNPDKDIRILFMRDNYINRGSKTRYTDWCKKRNIKCAVSYKGEVPDEWL